MRLQTMKMIINDYYDADYSYYFNKINLTLISGPCGQSPHFAFRLNWTQSL